MDSTYYFLNNEILQIFICLLMQKKENKSFKTCKFVCKYSCDFSFNFYKDLKNYPEYNFEEIIYYSEKDSKYFEFKLINREKLVNFIQDYINFYKKGELKSKNYSEVNKKIIYYPYNKNLEYMEKTFEDYMNESGGFNFTINSEFLNNPKFSINGRVLEFILEVYIQEQNFIKMNDCRVYGEASLPPRTIFIDIDITLSPDFYEIFTLLKNPAKIVKEKQKNYYSLTDREREVADLIIIGKQDKEIAEKLKIKESTAQTHVKNIRGKLEVTNRTEIISKILGTT